MGLQSLLVWGSLLGLLIYLIHKLIVTKNNEIWRKKGVKLIKLDNFVSRILLKQTTVHKLEEMMYKQIETAPYAGYTEFSKPTLLIKDLDIAKQIYVKDFDHFINRRNFHAEDNHWNKMLFNLSDQTWKDLRSAMSPTFSTGKIRRMYPIVHDCSKRLLIYLKEITAANSGIVNLEDVLGKYTMDVISSAAFGIESGIFKDPDSAISKMSKKLQFNFSPLMVLRFFASQISPSIAKIAKFKVVDPEAGEFFSKLLKDSIKYRETSGVKRNDFLQLMIETKNGGLQNEKGDEMDIYEKDAQLAQDKKRKIEIDDEVIVANCILFIFGGFDTTQSALMFGAYSLALYPDIQEMLRREVQDAAENNNGELTYDMIHKLEYLDKVINEILRMYPPSVRNERRCSKDYKLPNSDIVIPKDCIVGIPVYQIHHDEKNFPNPEVFDPERFSPEEKAKRHPYAFQPFGHGPRNCIANRFALTEMKAAIANLVMNFEIETCAKTTIPMTFGRQTFLKPIDGMWLKLNPISQ